MKRSISALRASTPSGFYRPGRRVVRAAVPAFGVTVFDEGPHLLAWCLRNIRAAYPHAPVFVISDGHDDPEYRTVCRWSGAEYRLGDRLKLLRHGAAWWHRFLSLAGAAGTAYAFKIDPDTWLHRPFRSYPDLDVFGSLVGSLVQGGIQGFSAHAMTRLLQSGVCLDPAYRDPRTWAFDASSKSYVRSRGQISTDYLLLHMTRRLGLRSGEWDEVDSMWIPTRPFRPGAAATHPHKDLPLQPSGRVPGEGEKR